MTGSESPSVQVNGRASTDLEREFSILNQRSQSFGLSRTLLVTMRGEPPNDKFEGTVNARTGTRCCAESATRLVSSRCTTYDMSLQIVLEDCR